MARRRATNVRKKKPNYPERRPAPWWQWGLGILVVGGFVYFLYSLNKGASNESVPEKAASEQAASLPPAEARIRETPDFSFYTMLPEQEVIIPEGEIKTRKRQERLGRAKPGQYVIQAGSFRSIRDADRLKAKLALLGVEAKIQPATIRGTQWYRVRIGPFKQMNEVEKIRTRLRQNRIDSVVQAVKQ